MIARLVGLLMVAMVSGRAILREFKSMQGNTMLFSPSSHSTSSFHRCHFKGYPDRLDKVLSPSQLYQPDSYYYGRSRRKNYYQHLFTASECENGLPVGECLSAMHKTFQCGLPGDWSILSPLDLDGPGIMWKNSRPCHSLLEASLTVDFYCPSDDLRVDLFQCNFEGAPTKIEEGSGISSNTKTDSPLGYYNVTFSQINCNNGYPDLNSTCLTSLRWLEFCGEDDHDWEAFDLSEDGALGVRWYSPHVCEAAKVGVDYYCPQDENEKGKIHSCAKVAPSVNDGSCDRAFFSDGTCRHLDFTDSDCQNGLPSGKCVVAPRRLRECGAEENFEAYGGDSDAAAGVRWVNALASGPCGPAQVAVDYLCFKECKIDCGKETLDEVNCRCIDDTSDSVDFVSDPTDGGKTDKTK